MRIAHWCELNLRSGLGHTATSIVEAEQKLGLDSIIVDCNVESDWAKSDDADVHVCHLFMPLPKLRDGKPKVWVAHGTPEVMFETAYQDTTKGIYGHSDSWMLAQWWLQNADVTVTFWPRHEAIWKSLSDRNTRIEGVPLGVDLDFWKPQATRGKFTGEPSLFTAENCYSIKWPLDLFIAWPWVVGDGLPEAKLHAIYVPMDQHRQWFPLINRNGCAFHSYVSNRVFDREELRNAFCSTDFYVGLVRYGDHNHIGLQANASGAKTISYTGNPYSDYWVEFGDQRVLAQQLSAIVKGQVQPRAKSPVPSLTRTAERMVEVYKSLVTKGTVTVVVPKRAKRVPKSESKLTTATIQ